MSSETTDKMCRTAGADACLDLSPMTSTGGLTYAIVPWTGHYDEQEQDDPYACAELKDAKSNDVSIFQLPSPRGGDEEDGCFEYDARAPQHETTPKRFGDDAMRVLQTCQILLTGGECAEDERERVIAEISLLMKRYSRHAEPSKSSISRHRRYSLGAEARRILKGWVDLHIDDPYPSVSEKHELAMAAGLSIKQVNDWFTNFRKRHWEDEMYSASVREHKSARLGV